jgi:hypothetical protein
LSETLGYPVFFDPEWPMLWDTLKPYYPDQATFIPKISETVVAWCDAFTSWLESEDNEADVEKLLDLLKNGSRLKLMLEVRHNGVWITLLLTSTRFQKNPLDQRPVGICSDLDLYSA